MYKSAMRVTVWVAAFILLFGLVAGGWWMLRDGEMPPGIELEQAVSESDDTATPRQAGAEEPTAAAPRRHDTAGPAWLQQIEAEEPEDLGPPAPTGSVYGRLAWQDNRLPIEGARVALQRAARDTVIPEPGEDVVLAEDDPGATARTTRTGEFELVGVPRQDNLFLRFELRDGTVEIQDLRTLPEPGQRVWQGEYQIEARGEIVGTVLTPDGRRLGGVRVRAVDELRFDDAGVPDGVRDGRIAGAETLRVDRLPNRSSRRRRLAARQRLLPYPNTTTNADGEFALRGVREGNVHLILQHEDLVARRVSLPVAAGRTTDVGAIVLERGTTVTVRLVDRDLDPIAGMAVAVQPVGWRFGPTARRTDARGEVTFVLDTAEDEPAALGKGVRVKAQRAPAHPWGFLGVVSPPGAEFVLEAVETIDVSLRSWSGVSLRAVRLGTRPKIPSLRWTRYDDRCQIGGLAPEVGCTLYAIAEGHAPGVESLGSFGPAQRPLDIDPDDEEAAKLPEVKSRSSIVLTLVPADQRVRVRVIDDASRPVEGARVSFSAGPLSPGWTGVPGVRWPSLVRDVFAGVSGPDGLIEVDGLWATDFMFTISHPERGSVTVYHRQSTTGEVLEVRLPLLARLTGMIVEKAAPVTRRFRVRASQPTGAFGLHRTPIEVDSNDEGRFAFPRIGAGSWTLDVLDPDVPDAGPAFRSSRSTRSYFSCPASLIPGRRLDLTLDLSDRPRRPRASGSVRVGGVPSPGVRVEAWGLDEPLRTSGFRPGGRWPTGPSLLHITTTGNDGRFEVFASPRSDAEIRVSLRRRGGWIDVARVPWTKEDQRKRRAPIAIDIPVGDLVLELRDRDGQPLANRPVALVAEDGPRVLVVADRDGIVQEHGLPAATYHVGARTGDGSVIVFDPPVTVPAGDTLTTFRRAGNR